MSLNRLFFFLDVTPYLFSVTIVWKRREINIRRILLRSRSYENNAKINIKYLSVKHEWAHVCHVLDVSQSLVTVDLNIDSWNYQFWLEIFRHNCLQFAPVRWYFVTSVLSVCCVWGKKLKTILDVVLWFFSCWLNNFVTEFLFEINDIYQSTMI